MYIFEITKDMVVTGCYIIAIYRALFVVCVHKNVANTDIRSTNIGNATRQITIVKN